MDTDRTIGYLAGADFRMGREAKSEFGESIAPEKADKMTMGASVQWYSVDNGKNSSFPDFSYGVEFNDKNCEKVLMGEWTWETGMNLDQISEFTLGFTSHTEIGSGQIAYCSVSRTI